jgi:hypothetical protein
MGYRQLSSAALPDPSKVWPVRVMEGAFGDGLPRRDLLLSPEHAVWVDGLLVPVRHLIDDALIVTAPCDRITYWHIELDSHDVVLAEGLPCESWLDTGNRGMFQNADVADLNPIFATGAAEAWARHACAPLVEDGPALHAIRAALAARHHRPGAAHVVHLAGAGTLTARIPAHATSVRFMSDSGYSPGDWRRLGALIAAISLDDEDLALDGEGFREGFHVPERHNGRCVRWTSGDAILALVPAAAARTIRVTVGTTIADDDSGHDSGRLRPRALAP